jgi:hypothetical protein
MVTTTLLKALGCLCVFVGTTVSRPSIDYGSFDHGSLLPLVGMHQARSEPFETRGVYGGRKKRYIIEREEPAKACKKKDKKCDTPEEVASKKLLCLPGNGFDIRQCKCVKCKPGRATCEDDCEQGIATMLDTCNDY